MQENQSLCKQKNCAKLIMQSLGKLWFEGSTYWYVMLKMVHTSMYWYVLSMYRYYDMYDCHEVWHCFSF